MFSKVTSKEDQRLSRAKQCRGTGNRLKKKKYEDEDKKKKSRTLKKKGTRREGKKKGNKRQGNCVEQKRRTHGSQINLCHITH